jgi:hypothetical protein
MGAKGFYLSQDGHIVQLYMAKDYNGQANSSPVFTMRNYEHASIIIQLATAPRAAGIITINSCIDVVPSVAIAIPFDYFQCLTAYTATNGDVLSTRYQGTTSGIIPATGTNGIMYVIELSSEQLLVGHIGFQLAIANPGASSLLSAVAILSGARFAGDQQPTALA